MRAFKFRSAAQIEFALDIILNRRLFCSDWRTLNDPMEGAFFYTHNGVESEIQRRVKGIGSAKSEYKVCSLAGDFQSHLLWSHYAGGFDGVAIEVELSDHSRHVKRVDYRAAFAFLNMDEIVDEREAARRILFSKYDQWSYEEEIRVLHSTNYYKLRQSPVRVIAGHRMGSALFSTLMTICRQEGIEFGRVRIGNAGLDVDRVICGDEMRAHRDERFEQ